MSVEKVPEGKCIPNPKINATSVMVAYEMLKNGFVPGKGLGSALQGITQPVSLPENLGTFGLGFKPTAAGIKIARKLKQRTWVLPKPVPRLSRSFVKSGTRSRPVTTIPSSVINPDKELIERFEKLFDSVNMVEIGEAHLRGYCSKMRGARGKDELSMAYVSQSLSGIALEWYTCQDSSMWYTWDDLAQAFAWHFYYNIDIVPDRLSLAKVEKKPSESFRKYGFRWREQAARVNPPMEEDEMVEYFLQTMEPTYLGHLISAIDKPFNDVVKMGEIVEEGLKSSKIMSYSALKATTQAIKKKHDDVAMAVLGSPHSQRETGNRGEQRQRNSFTPIGESYTSLFEKLKQSGLIEPLLGHTPHPYAKAFDPTVRFMYHSNVQGYSIEDCRALKREIERMIQEGIIVHDNDTQNITQNPLPAHDDARFVGMMRDDREYQNPLGNLLTEVNDI
ncbi:uncharacterized protein [Nicotiana sylvestris]|uniref:uncharacterized protein n=1 Tax=Nicotiana sylvestris TaxID=4096 RepID=UPI00388CC029